ncbi:condensation domain-containing protein [Actinomycetospora aeridis]|uniref:Condensation domain-containing protein n=1 Tax=Actinomycetospora aeridis TaxID=3129231 RepID=A0ABU8N2G9_9PSEU
MNDLPLTGAQEGIWFAHHLDPANPSYTTGERIDITGPLAGDVLAAAIHDAVSETEALHVRFVVRDGEPRQIPVPPGERAPWTVTRVDLRAEPDPESAAQAWMDRALAEPADLDGGPLFAQAVLRLGEDRHVWFHRYHQVVMDAYGQALVARRVATLYAARLAVDAAPRARWGGLAELVEADVEARRRAAEDDRAFWAQRFPGPPEPATLAGHTRRVSGSFLRRSSRLPPEVVVAMEAAADRAKGHWPELVLAAVALYLRRLSPATGGAPDVVLGVPMMGRLGSSGAPAARTPGMLVNIVPLRLHAGPTTTVGELVAAVVAELAAVRAHQHYRFEDLRRDLRLDAADGPRGEAALVGPWVNVRPVDTLRFGARTTGTGRPLSGGAVHDLAVHVQRGPDGGLLLDVDANPATYDAAALEGHHARLDALLRTLATTPPDRTLAAVPLIDGDARAAAVAAGRGAPVERLPADDLAGLLGTAAREHPDRPAVVTPEGTVLTHAELDRRARGLAARLRDAGAGPGTLVAVALRRGPEPAVAVLAVLHAGAAWLPVDVDAPAARRALVLEDAAPTLALVSAETRDAVPGLPSVDVTEGGSGAAAPAAVDDAHPALVVPVPGAQGRPEPVVVPRAALRTRLADLAVRIGLAPRRTLVAAGPVDRDATALDLLLPAVTGAAVLVAPTAAVEDPAALAGLLATHEGPVLAAAPTRWRAMVDAAPGALAGVTALVAGEAMPTALLAGLDLAGADVTHLHGATEATVWSTVAAGPDLPRRRPGVPSRAPIGRALTGTRTRVLDRALQDVPDGTVGELHVAGAALATGYLRRPALTAARFVADPSGAPGERMVRTGDLVRRDHDGTLRLVGRADTRITVGGHPVEPGEVEAVLEESDDVAEAAVSLRDDRLVAHVVPAGAAPTPADVLARLAAALPEHMVPSAVVIVGEFPRTADGRVDTARLPLPPPGATTTRRAAEGPREELVCRLVAEVLGLGAVGPDDDFFALGGQSLLATKLVARVAEETGRTLEVRDVFDAPTAGGLAVRLERPEATPPVHPLPRPAVDGEAVPAP